MTDLDDRSRAIADLLDHTTSSLAVRPGSLEQVRRRARQRHQRRVAGVGVVGATALIGGVVALAGRDGDDRSVVPAGTTAGSGVETSSVVGVDTTSPRSPDSPVLSRGSTGELVVRAQDRLRQLGFDPGPSDGVFGTQTEQAVWAFEGLVLGRTWQEQTGTLDERSLDTLYDTATALRPLRSDPDVGDHTEIRLELQTLAVFQDGKAALATHISSGSGETWCEIITQDTDDTGQLIDPPVQKDVCGDAVTPGGVFKVYRRYEGNRQGPLGGMHNPVYFNYGIAVHGAQNVPREPESHGGIRIPMAIAEYFPSLVENDDMVFVWDGVKEPEQQSETDMLPHFTYPNPG